MQSTDSPRENLRWHVSGVLNVPIEQIDQALAQVGLIGYEDSPCHALSAGQQRRVNLARLYLCDAPLWLLDEPFTAIDKDGVAQLEARLVSHLGDGGAVILTSHQALSLAHPVSRLSLSEGVQS